MSKVICLDLEMNQPSDKIIQLGYVIGDIVTGRIFEERSLIVDPEEPLGGITRFKRESGDGEKEYIPISEFTGITEERIREEGMSLEDAYQILLQDIKKHNPTTTCVQWGDGSKDNKGDHDCLRRQLKLDWDSFVFRPRAWDVKSYFQIYRAFNREGVIGGVNAALKVLGMEFEGKEHDALCDAKNTFRIFREIGSRAVKFDKMKKITEE